jgi:putative FmdB family regulatory protein
MPLYTYKCGTCGRELDQFSKVAERDHGPSCCDAEMARKLSAPMV